jgi:hypothetical protein
LKRRVYGVPFAPAIVVVMTEGKGTPTAKQEKEAQQSKPWPLRERWGKTNWDWLQLGLQLVGVLAIPL